MSAATMQDVIDAAKAQQSLIASIKGVLSSAHSMLVEAVDTGDAAKVQEALDLLKTNNDALAAAAVENTPAAAVPDAPPAEPQAPADAPAA